MEMDATIKKILEAGVLAPSGGNSQPWRFRVKDKGIIEVIALPERDHPILNFRNRGTLVAHGALLENIGIASSCLGYKAETEMFPDKTNLNLVARVVLRESVPIRNPLYSAISFRVTNRKPYRDRMFTEEQKSALLNIRQEVQDGEVRWIQERDKMKRAGEALSVSEFVMFMNKILHRLLFEEIVWTEGEEKTKGGLYVRTMELAASQRAALRMLRYWPVMRFFNVLGISRLIARDNARVYASGSALGAILINDKDEDFITAGRLMQGMWLTITHMGLSFHPITGILFLWQKIRGGETKDFTPKQVALIREAYHNIESVFGVGEEKIIALCFRVGEGGKPSARASRRDPAIEWTS